MECASREGKRLSCFSPSPQTDGLGGRGRGRGAQVVLADAETARQGCPDQRGRRHSYLFLQEWVVEGLADAEAFGRVQHQDLVQQVLQLGDLAQLVLW